MLLAIPLTISGIMFILALIYFIGFLVDKRMTSNRKKYQEHIDNLVEELFPPAIQTPSVQTPAVNTYTPTANEPDPQEDTGQ